MKFAYPFVSDYLFGANRYYLMGETRKKIKIRSKRNGSRSYVTEERVDLVSL